MVASSINLVTLKLFTTPFSTHVTRLLASMPCPPATLLPPCYSLKERSTQQSCDAELSVLKVWPCVHTLPTKEVQCKNTVGQRQQFSTMLVSSYSKICDYFCLLGLRPCTLLHLQLEQMDQGADEAFSFCLVCMDLMACGINGNFLCSLDNKNQRSIQPLMQGRECF